MACSNDTMENTLTCALMQECLCGDLATVISLIDSRATAHYQTETGDSPLKRACRNEISASSIVNHLLGLGVDPNPDGDMGGCALTVAILCNNRSVVNLLLEARADLDTKDDHGWTPLMHASKWVNSKRGLHILRSLHPANAMKANHRGETALSICARHACPEFVGAALNFLTLIGSPVNATDKLGKTALMNAVINSREAVETLVNTANVNINAVNYIGWTALMYAVEESAGKSSDVIVKMLIDSKADVRVQDSQGWNALMIAARFSNKTSNLNTVKMLVPLSDLTQTSTEGWTPLMQACRFATTDSNVQTIECLLDAGINVNAQSVAGWTALTVAIACREGRAAVPLLLKRGANPHLRTKYGKNALDRAVATCQWKHGYDILQLLAPYKCELRESLPEDAFARSLVLTILGKTQI